MARNQQLSPYRTGGEIGRGADPFMSLHREMNRMFDDVFRGFGLPSPMGQGRGQDQQGAAMLQPDIDVSETDKEFKICADLPGVSENDVDITLEDDVLQIRAHRQQERKQEKENYHVVERSYGEFRRALRLPANIDAEQVQAKFENGVLTVTIPKTEEAQRSRRIQVQGGKGGSAQQSAQQHEHGQDKSDGGEDQRHQHAPPNGQSQSRDQQADQARGENI